MAAVYLLCVKPKIVLSCQTEGQLLILVVVSAHINGIAIGGLKPHGLALSGLHPLLTAVLFQIAPLLQFPADLFQVRFRVRTIQFFQNALQVAALHLSYRQLIFQFLLRIFHTGVVFVVLCRILLGRKGNRQRNIHHGHILIVKVLCLQDGLAFLDAVQVGCHNVTKLTKPLPVVGGLQFLFLHRHLPIYALAKIAYSLSHRLTLLVHGIFSVFYHIEAI